MQSITRSKKNYSLPPLSQLLTLGGDRRILCDPASGANKYECRPEPDAGLLPFGSATASTISAHAFAAAEGLRLKLEERALAEAPETTYAHELERIRQELRQLLKLQNTDIVFAASGTDLMLLSAQLACPAHGSYPVVLMMESSETGSGVPAALAGKHFSDTTVSGERVVSGAALDGSLSPEVKTIAIRHADGSPRSMGDIDQEFTAEASRANASGRPVLLILTDVSKTGLIVPSPACALDIRYRFPQTDILVDACQLRLCPATIQGYLEQGCMVAITGSKFISGPAFSGALLIPQSKARLLRSRSLPPSLGAYGMRADWPEGWAARQSFPDLANYGLLLRWQAALTEMQRFYTLTEPAVTDFTRHFAQAIKARVAGDPAFEMLSMPTPDRGKASHSIHWDHTQTIFPFLLRSGSRAWLSRGETELLYKRLRRDYHIELGQPVLCGSREGVPVSALRLCLSARLITDALSAGGRGEDGIIKDALYIFDKAAALISS